jgi:hypothetical protein
MPRLQLAHLCRLERCTEVVRYLKYCGRAAQVIGTAVRDPLQTNPQLLAAR